MPDFIESTPVGKTNAIEAAAFIVGFTQPLGEGYLRGFEAATESLESELPGKQETKAVSEGTSQEVLLESTRFITDAKGGMLWRLHASGNSITVHCTEYTTFNEVWAKVNRLLNTALQPLDSALEVLEVGLQIVDKFHYPAGMSAESYNCVEVFREGSEFLTAKALKSGPLWHVFQGWFEPREGGGRRLLNQLQLSSTELVGQRMFATVIDHRATLKRGPDSWTLGNLRDDSNTDANLVSIFNRLHIENNSIARGLLNDNKLQQIGLTNNHE